jgi:hypothetical protein
MGKDHQALERPARRVRMDTTGVLGGDANWSVAAILRAAGIDVADAEPPPKQISEQLAARYHFGHASARCGALGNVRQVLQLVQAATGAHVPKNGVWTAPDGSFIDGLRPDVDPYGFASKADAAIYRAAHLAAVLKLLHSLTVLILPLRNMEGLVDDADGTVYPAKPAGAKLPRGCKLVPTAFSMDTTDADFAALHAALAKLRPGLAIRLVIAGPALGMTEIGIQAQLRGLAALWTATYENVRYDPVLDHLLIRMAQPDADTRLAPLIRTLIGGADILDAVAGSAHAKATPSAEKRDRAQRRAERAKAKEGKVRPARVICEDELLEAFS